MNLMILTANIVFKLIASTFLVFKVNGLFTIKSC